jgi:hypothetical protein
MTEAGNRPSKFGHVSGARLRDCRARPGLDACAARTFRQAANRSDAEQGFMRQFLKKVAHRLSRIPVVGRVVQVTAANYHLPAIRGQAHAAWTSSQIDVARLRLLESRHHELADRLQLIERASLDSASRESARLALADRQRLAEHASIEAAQQALADRLVLVESAMAADLP